MRHRALALLLALTAGDYVLWHWSVAGSHDVLALASGLTLPPLGAISLGLLGLTTLRLLARSLRGSSTMARSVPPSRDAAPGRRPNDVNASGSASPPDSDTPPDSAFSPDSALPPKRLAA